MKIISKIKNLIRAFQKIRTCSKCHFFESTDTFSQHWTSLSTEDLIDGPQDKNYGCLASCVIRLSLPAFFSQAPQDIRLLLCRVLDSSFPSVSAIGTAHQPESLRALFLSMASSYLSAAQCVSCVYLSGHGRSGQPQYNLPVLEPLCKREAPCLDCIEKTFPEASALFFEEAERRGA